ncbi:MAG TPA: surface-adhesin E family protein [Croceibacterium sp.]|nr:surface-adhesin E family protein [Croceibacterium sp.]
MRSSIGVALWLAAGLAGPAAAEDWYRIASSDNSVDYADADTVRSFGDLVSVDVVRGFGEPEGPAGYLKIAVDVSCADNRFRISRGVAYDLQRQSLSTDEIVTEWQAIAANSIAEKVRRFTCDGALRGAPVANPFDDADAYWSSDYDA